MPESHGIKILRDNYFIIGVNGDAPDLSAKVSGVSDSPDNR